MCGGPAELIDEVAEVGVIEVHVFMDIGKTERGPARGSKGRRL